MRRWKTRKKTSHVLKTTRLSSLNAVINFAKSKRTSSKCQALTAKAAASSGAGGWAVKRLQCHALTNLWSYCMRQKVLFYQRIKLNKNHIKYTCNIEISNWGNRQNLSKTRVNLYTLIMTWQILYVIKYVRARRAGVDKRQIQEKWSFFNVLNTWKLFVFVHTTPLLHAFPTWRLIEEGAYVAPLHWQLHDSSRFLIITNATITQAHNHDDNHPWRIIKGIISRVNQSGEIGVGIALSRATPKSGSFQVRFSWKN